MVCEKKLLTYAGRAKETTKKVKDLSQIYSDLLAIKNGSSSKMSASLPDLCISSAYISNDSGSPNRERN